MHRLDAQDGQTVTFRESNATEFKFSTIHDTREVRIPFLLARLLSLQAMPNREYKNLPPGSTAPLPPRKAIRSQPGKTRHD